MVEIHAQEGCFSGRVLAAYHPPLCLWPASGLLGMGMGGQSGTGTSLWVKSSSGPDSRVPLESFSSSAPPSLLPEQSGPVQEDSAAALREEMGEEVGE